MPPKSRRGPERSDSKDSRTEESLNHDSRNDISGGKTTKDKGKGKVRAPTDRRLKPASDVPHVFKDMLAEALTSPNVDPEPRPRKRRRVRQPADDPSNDSELSYVGHGGHHGSDEDSIALKQKQTAYNDLEDSTSESDLIWEDVGIANLPQASSGAGNDEGNLDLTLAPGKSPEPSSASMRRKVLSKADRTLRLHIHKMHLLCLLSFVDRRNNWCNDSKVQDNLKPLINQKMAECLEPKKSYTQFGRAESVKKGLSLVTKMWETKFSITSKGMQRSLWAESEEIRDVGGKTLL